MKASEKINTMKEKPQRPAMGFFWPLPVAALSLGRGENPSVMESLQSITRPHWGENFLMTHPADKGGEK